MFRKLHEIKHPVTLYIDGEACTAEADETVAAVLLRQKQGWARKKPISGALRAPYCMMGVCFECLAKVDGAGSVQTCLVPVRDGMRVERQVGPREVGV